MLSLWRLVVALFLLTAVRIPAAGAQGLREEPISLFNGRVIVGGEAMAAIAPRDQEAWFNYTDYEHDAMRVVRLALSATVRAGRRVSFLGEVQADNFNEVRPYAMFMRLRPWPDRNIDIQAGLIPPVFGQFARRGYTADNPLIGLPLAYQYLTSIRGDAIPSTADDLLRMRGRGWRVTYPIGSQLAQVGLPLVNALRWDTGVQVSAGWRALEVAGAVTSGTLANPRVGDDNGGKQVSGRIAFRPSAGLSFGFSAARGASLSRLVTRTLPAALADDTYTQRAVGADAEISQGHWILRTEGVFSSWNLPAVASPRIDSRLGARALSVEGRYTLRPGLYVAGRADWLDFSDIQGSPSLGGPMPWDAPVRRLEVGAGYYLRRNVVLKGVYQHNRRSGGFRESLRVPSVQLLYWF